MPTSPVADVKPIDRILVEQLLHLHPLLADQADTLWAWWWADRMGRESLASFLIRQRLLPAEVEAVLLPVAKGYASSNLLVPFVQQADVAALLHALHSRAPSPSVPGEPTHERPALQDTLAEIGTGPISAAILPARRASTIGEVLGKCRLLEPLGQGAHGQVFRAHHETLDTNVAVKVLRLTDVADREVRQRALHAEAKILARISHPNVIRVLDFENDAEYPYLVLEYIDGFVLSDLLQQCGRLVPERALAIITQTAQALAAAYQVGVVHRDVKPANILLTAEGDVKLADLGLAGVLGELQLGTTGDGQPLLWGGTLPYMPSEQFTHPSVNCRADIYALGVCFYQMLTGTLPYQANTPMELLLAHSERPIPPLAQTLPDLAPAWDKLLRRMLSQEANMRPAYAELVTELRRLATVSASKSALRQAAPKSGSQLLRWLGWERKN